MIRRKVRRPLLPERATWHTVDEVIYVVEDDNAGGDGETKIWATEWANGEGLDLRVRSGDDPVHKLELTWEGLEALEEVIDFFTA